MLIRWCVLPVEREVACGEQQAIATHFWEAGARGQEV